VIKKLLLAGGSGQIGRELIYNLVKDFKIIATYNNYSKKLIKDKNVKWIKIDFSKNKRIAGKFDYIINCIASHEFTKNVKKINYINSNITSVKNLINIGKQKKIKIFINLSTISIYAPNKNVILKESSRKDTFSLLGRTKYKGENIIKNSKLNYINLRLPGVISKQNKNRPWLNQIATKIKNHKTVKVFNINNNYNAVIDVLEIGKIIKYIIINKKKIRKTFNCSASTPIKIKDIINYLIKIYNSKSKIKILKNKKKTVIVSIKKISEDFDYNLPNTWTVIKRNFNK
jgi:nucleoside-diphosphate-sugar epimerase